MLFLMTVDYLAEPTQPQLDAHIAWLVPQFERGLFLFSGGLDAVPGRPAGAIGILQAESRDAALAILDDEPFHLAGVVRHDVVPFHPRVRRLGLDEAFDVPDIVRTVA